MPTSTSPFAHRGLIEGFYGPPYSHADRLWLLDKLGAWGMNRYVYAPKDDPLHREQWRTPYDAAALREFGALVAHGAAVGVEVGFAISPGLTIEYGNADDVQALQAKFRAFAALGARFFSLALDDVPTTLLHHADQQRFGCLAAAHVHLTHAVAAALGDATLWMVPTDYIGAAPTDYLEQLGAELDPAIEVGWTGRTVVSPTITAAEAARRAATLRRKLLLWDNVPVADGPMRPMLHLGPFTGRDAELAAHASGVILNPMVQAHASGVALHTAAAYLRDPRAYDADAAWQAAVTELGAGAPDAFALFAAAHRFSPSLPDDRDRELEAAFAVVRASLDAGADASAGLAAFQAALMPRLQAAETLRAGLADRALLAEIEAWLTAHRAETERMQAAAELLDMLGADVNPMQRVFAFFRLEGMLTRIATPSVASYGPRRVLYPQLGSMRDDGASFGDDPCLFVDRCLADEVVRYAERLALERLK
ncbi:MAG: protein O-GlcNAcase [Deltaproteobacteria bacterium]|nr:protein O-GlcNAcase [Deltaproteobacteria bacterium]